MKPLTILLIAAALATGAGVAGSTLRDHFEAPKLEGSSEVVIEDMAAEHAGVRRPGIQNAMLVAGVVGGAMCLLLGAAAGWVVRRRPVPGAIVGLLAGTAAGAAGGFLGAYFIPDRIPDNLTAMKGPVVHGTLWLLVAVALTLAIAITTRSGKALGLLGRLLLSVIIATAIYPVIAAIAFPLLNSEKVIPEGLVNTALWIALPAGLFALAIAQATRAAAEASPGGTPAAATKP